VRQFFGRAQQGAAYLTDFTHAFLADGPRSYLVADLNNDDVFETGIILSNVTSLSALGYEQIV